MRLLRDLVPFIALFLGFMALVFFVSRAHASAGFVAPSMSEYYESLRQPDYPNTSCCGEGDAYFASRTEPCSPLMSDCALVAIVTDTRPDVREVAPGVTISRRHVDVGTKIVIPRSKVRKHPIPNPTDENIVFIGYNNSVLCWEPISGN